MSLPESSNEADWTHDISQETLESEGTYLGHPLHRNLHAADDGWYYNLDLRKYGGLGDGAAAKFDIARTGANTSLVQKNIRMRRRLNKPPELVTNMQPEKSRCASSYRPDLPRLLSPDCHVNNSNLSKPSLTDISNYLPIPAIGSENIGCPPTTSDDEAFRYASPVEDMYGWDAELERRQSSPSRASISSTEGCDTIALSYRRANGSKHSLLQRVFRVGSSSSVSKMETVV